MRAPPLCLLPLQLPDPTSETDVARRSHVAPSIDSAATSLLDLPPELLTALCALIDCRTVVWCRLVCRRLRDVIDGSLELQYRIALVRDGMVDRRPPRQAAWMRASSSEGDKAGLFEVQQAESVVAQLTLGDRLDRLRRLRTAWKTLDWTRCVRVPIPGPCCAYELVGGIFCKTQPRGGGRRAFGNVVDWWPGDDDGTGDGLWNGEGEGHEHGHGHGDGDEDVQHGFGSRTMSATWLPGTDDPGRTVVREDVGIPTRDFAMDPSQDLMVLFKSGEDAGFPMAVAFPGALELHVRTISTNETHPEARVPVLCMPVLYPVTSVCVQIVEDVVGMMYCVDPARPRITIWNWQTGNLVVDCSGGNLPPGTWDFSFVNSRALFVTTGNGSGSLELLTFTDPDPDPDSLTPTQPEAEPRPISSLTHVATLHLPPVHPSVRLLSVGTHTGPFLAGCPPDKPFVTSNEERIHVLTVQYIHLPTFDGPVTRPRVCAFVHNRVFEEYLERGTGTDACATTATAMVVPWSEWGRKHVRMLHHVGMFQWLRYVHGQRVVMLLPTSEAGRSTLQVLDFNPHSVFDADDDEAANADADALESREKNKHDDADPALRKTVIGRVNQPTRIVMPHIFVNVVETGLPYREVRRDVRGDYSGVMIDDERLVGLKYPAFLTGDMKEIDVFTM